MRKLFSYERQAGMRFRLVLYAMLLVANVALGFIAAGHLGDASYIRGEISLQTFLVLLRISAYVAIAFQIFQSMYREVNHPQAYLKASLPVSGMQRAWTKILSGMLSLFLVLLVDWGTKFLFEVVFVGRAEQLDRFIRVSNVSDADPYSFLFGIVMQLFFFMSALFFSLVAQKAWFSKRSRRTGRRHVWADLWWFILFVGILIITLVSISVLQINGAYFLHMPTMTIGKSFAGAEVILYMILLPIWSIQQYGFPLSQLSAQEPTHNLWVVFSQGLSLIPFLILVVLSFGFAFIAGSLLENKIDY